MFISFFVDISWHSLLLTFFSFYRKLITQIHSKFLAIVVKNTTVLVGRTLFTIEALAKITEERFETFKEKSVIINKYFIYLGYSHGLT